MSAVKFLKGTIAGGIAFFLLGFLVYGMLLMDFMQSNYNNCMNRPADGMIWWAMILANLAYAALLALIFGWAGVTRAVDGLRKGAVIGFIISLSIALSYYSRTTMYNNTGAIVLDVAAATVVGALVAAVVAWAMNMGGKGKD